MCEKMLCFAILVYVVVHARGGIGVRDLRDSFVTGMGCGRNLMSLISGEAKF